MTQKTWIDLLGIPENNEQVVDNFIVRKYTVDPSDSPLLHSFVKVLWIFDTPEQAQENYNAWMDEYSELSFKDGEKQ